MHQCKMLASVSISDWILGNCAKLYNYTLQVTRWLILQIHALEAWTKDGPFHYLLVVSSALAAACRSSYQIKLVSWMSEVVSQILTARWVVGGMEVQRMSKAQKSAWKGCAGYLMANTELNRYSNSAEIQYTCRASHINISFGENSCKL